MTKLSLLLLISLAFSPLSSAQRGKTLNPGTRASSGGTNPSVTPPLQILIDASKAHSINRNMGSLAQEYNFNLVFLIPDRDLDEDDGEKFVNRKGGGLSRAVAFMQSTAISKAENLIPASEVQRARIYEEGAKILSGGFRYLCLEQCQFLQALAEVPKYLNVTTEDELDRFSQVLRATDALALAQIDLYTRLSDLNDKAAAASRDNLFDTKLLVQEGATKFLMCINQVYIGWRFSPCAPCSSSGNTTESS